jgi:hypothetical protein
MRSKEAAFRQDRRDGSGYADSSSVVIFPIQDLFTIAFTAAACGVSGNLDIFV